MEIILWHSNFKLIYILSEEFEIIYCFFIIVTKIYIIGYFTSDSADVTSESCLILAGEDMVLCIFGLV